MFRGLTDYRSTCFQRRMTLNVWWARFYQKATATFFIHVSTGGQICTMTSRIGKGSLTRFMKQSKTSRLMSACGSAHAIEGITFGSEHILHAVLSQKGAPDSLTLSKLSSPIYPSFLSEARFLLWKIKKAEGEEKNELAKTFLKEYAWIENSYLGSAKLTIEHVFRRAEELTSEPDLSEFDEIMKEKEAIMEQLSFNDRERFVVYSIDQCFKWQDDRKKNILESIEAFDPILDRLAVVLGLSPVAVK